MNNFPSKGLSPMHDAKPKPNLLRCSLLLLSITSTIFSAPHLTLQPRKGIDPDLAYAHVKQLVSFGPRPPGSPGIAQAQSYITSYLKTLGLEVEHQDFLATTPSGSIAMENILAKGPVAKDRVIILGSHYDTKVMHNSLFVGANDGGSSTGLLMELGRVISQERESYPVWFVFFDGEEAQKEWTENDSLYGSRHFIERLKADGMITRIKAMILLDMIGDRDLVLERDLSSTPWLLDLIIKSAQELGHGRHFAGAPRTMVDDHIPFIQAGIPAADLIDLDYGFANLYWHSPNDTLDKISPRSLKVAGEIVLRALEKLNAR
jgi:glutaminyl-peptide cyclotransferase